MSATLKSLRALSDPTRLRIVALLEKDELSVNELQEITRMGQSRISTHLGLLQDSGLVQSRREGKRTFYKLSPHGERRRGRIHPTGHPRREGTAGARRRPDQPEADPRPPPRTGAGLFQPGGGAVRPGLRPGPVVAGLRPSAAADSAAAGGGGPGLGRGAVERIAGAALQEGHRRGQLREDRGLRRRQGEEERT